MVSGEKNAIAFGYYAHPFLRHGFLWKKSENPRLIPGYVLQTWSRLPYTIFVNITSITITFVIRVEMTLPKCQISFEHIARGIINASPIHGPGTLGDLRTYPRPWLVTNMYGNPNVTFERCNENLNTLFVNCERTFFFRAVPGARSADTIRANK